MSLGHWRIAGSKFNIVKKSYLERIVVSFRSTKVFPLSFISSKLRRPPCPFAYVCVMYSVTSVVSDPLWLPWTITRQAPLSMEFSRQKYWSGFPCPLPGAFPNLGIEPTSLMAPVLAGGFFTTSLSWDSWTAFSHSVMSNSATPGSSVHGKAELNHTLWGILNSFWQTSFLVKSKSNLTTLVQMC